MLEKGIKRCVDEEKRSWMSFFGSFFWRADGDLHAFLAAEWRELSSANHIRNTFTRKPHSEARYRRFTTWFSILLWACRSIPVRSLPCYTCKVLKSGQREEREREEVMKIDRSMIEQYLPLLRNRMEKVQFGHF